VIVNCDPALITVPLLKCALGNFYHKLNELLRWIRGGQSYADPNLMNRLCIEVRRKRIAEGDMTGRNLAADFLIKFVKLLFSEALAYNPVVPFSSSNAQKRPIIPCGLSVMYQFEVWIGPGSPGIVASFFSARCSPDHNPTVHPAHSPEGIWSDFTLPSAKSVAKLP
jgi:hypothetical protein